MRAGLPGSFPRTGGQGGFSLVEILIASFVALVAMVGILYLYKTQSRNMQLQSGIAEMRMNGQYTLNELQYFLTLAGLGLPTGFRSLAVDGGDLIVKTNRTKKSAAATMLVSSSSAARTVYRISRADTAIFSGKAHAAVPAGAGALEAVIESVAPRSGVPSEALVTLLGDRDDFPLSTMLYPLDRMRLHRCTGIGADTAEGEFKVAIDNPGLRPGVRRDSLALAEGIESIAYRYLMLNRDTLAVLPGGLDSLQRIEIRVVVRTLARNPHGPGDGIHRDTLTARVSYRRGL